MRHREWIVLIGCLVALLVADYARAVGVELQGGITEFEAPSCGLWQRPCAGYPTEDKLKSIFARAGVFTPIYAHLEGHLFAYSLGKYSTNALAPDDEGCAAENQGSSPEICGGTSRYRTSGSVAGVGASLRNYFGIWFVESGLTYNRQTFKLSVTEKQSGVQDYEYGPEADYGLGSMIGGGVQFKSTLVGVYRYTSGADSKFYHHQYPSGVGQAFVLALGYRF